MDVPTVVAQALPVDVPVVATQAYLEIAAAETLAAVVREAATPCRSTASSFTSELVTRKSLSLT
jgi:hypothetical protein